MADSGYRANFRSQEYRPSRPPNSILFGAADDTAANAVAAELTSWTTGQLTSLMKTLFFARPASYPNGTRYTVNALLSADDGSVWRQRLLNGDSSVNDASWANIFTGQADAATGALALSAPPQIPGGGLVTQVSITQIRKFGDP